VLRVVNPLISRILLLENAADLIRRFSDLGCFLHESSTVPIASSSTCLNDSTEEDSSTRMLTSVYSLASSLSISIAEYWNWFGVANVSKVGVLVGLISMAISFKDKIYKYYCEKDSRVETISLPFQGLLLNTSHYLNGGINMGRKLTTDEFIARAVKIHGNTYTYKKTRYVNAKTKVNITCHIHGDFSQLPFDHMGGQGCSKCGSIRTNTYNTLNTTIFINNAKKIHNNWYDYSITKYISAKQKVDIICPIHGIFSMTPNNHLRGKGCTHCADMKASIKQRKTTEQFILDAIKVHGDKYDYHNVHYINAYTKVSIICKKHGEFLMAPTKHLSGQSCPKCKSSHGENINNIRPT